MLGYAATDNHVKMKGGTLEENSRHRVQVNMSTDVKLRLVVLEIGCKLSVY